MYLCPWFCYYLPNLNLLLPGVRAVTVSLPHYLIEVGDLQNTILVENNAILLRKYMVLILFQAHESAARAPSIQPHAEGTLGNILSTPKTVSVQHQPKLIQKEAPTEIHSYHYARCTLKIEPSPRRRSSGLSTLNALWVSRMLMPLYCSIHFPDFSLHRKSFL